MRTPSPALAVSVLALVTATTGAGYAAGGASDHARIAQLERDVAKLTAKSFCAPVTAVAVTRYHDPRTGLTYLAPTTNSRLRRRWVPVMPAKCAPVKPTKGELAWGDAPRRPAKPEHVGDWLKV
jgi:hypothetical protein